jgi:hypothetical protein
MSTRRMRRLFQLIAAAGTGALLTLVGAATALADHPPGPWP